MAENERSLDDLMEGMMTDLGDPTPSQLKYTLVFQKLLDSIQYYLNKANIGSSTFLLAKKRLNISSGRDEYPLSDIDNYGRGIFLDVIPANDFTGGENRVAIPVTDINNSAVFFQPPDDKPMVMVTRTQDGIRTMRIRPVPSTDYEGWLWYKPARIVIAALDTNPNFLEQFYVNVRKRAAWSAISYCDYEPQRKKDIAMGLMAEMQSHDATFELFLMQGSDVGGEKRPARYMRDDGM